MPARGFLMKIETAVGDFDGYLMWFAQGRIVAQLILLGPAGQVDLENVIPLAQLIDKRIRENSPSP